MKSHLAADPSTIWQVPAYLPYVQPELTDELVTNAESRLGYTLPAEFLDLLRVQNGGYIRFELPDVPHKVISGIGASYPSLMDFNWDDAQEYVSFQLDGLVPFDGDGHWHLCLDYRLDRDRPCITYADVECDSERKIADNFAEYLQLLQLDVDENDFVIPSVTDIGVIRNEVGSILGISFEEPDSWAHGYPVHRTCVEKSGPEWIWISPNFVQRGFVREEDARYEELRNLMPGMAKRYPMLPEESYIVSCTDSVRSKVLGAFAKASIELRKFEDFFDD